MTIKQIIRVFPRRTNATPSDDLVRIACAPGFFDEADEVHVSVTFTWDLPMAEELAELWRYVAPVKMGGPATGEQSGNFEPGMYLKEGHVITSRGCPNRCWFCSVWRRERDIRELPITEGYIVHDDNLLACSDAHINAVFDMLGRQKDRPRFRGGLEAARLQPWHVKRLYSLKPAEVFFAYDTADDWAPLVNAATLMFNAGIKQTNHIIRCFVLCGYPKDTLEQAEQRMQRVVKIGVMPMAMLYRDKTGECNIYWRRFQREWARPKIVACKIREVLGERVCDARDHLDPRDNMV